MVKLSDHFTYKKLLKFTFSPIMMMVFSSIYGIVDGFFVSNFAGKLEFTGLNFIIPIVYMFSAVCFMFSTGGTALIAKKLGEKDNEKANQIFSLIVYFSSFIGFILTIIGLLTIKPIAIAMGAEGDLLDASLVYARILLIGNVPLILQYEFQSYFSVAEKPHLGFYFTLASGILNIILDALFVGLFKWGIAGAAIASVLSQVVGGVFPVFYFMRKNSSLLKLGKTSFDGKSLLRVCTNGLSELLSNISMQLVGMLYNIKLLKYAEEDGVAAYGILMYVSFVFISIFIGYAIGSSPIIGYNYGAKNHEELHNVVKKSIVIVGITSVTMFLIGELLAKPFSLIFASYDEKLLNMTIRAFRIYSVSFLMSGICIFGSSFFTALNNGLVSAIISISRTLVFQVIAIIVLPIFFKLDGIWISVVVAEFLAMIVSGTMMLCYKKKYNY